MMLTTSCADDALDNHDSSRSLEGRPLLSSTELSDTALPKHDVPFKLPMIAGTGALFNLPVELRLQIYGFVFSTSGLQADDLAISSMRMLSASFRNIGRANNIMWSRACGNEPWACADLLCVSQQVHKEALQDYRSITMFAIAVEQERHTREDRTPHHEFSPQFGVHLQNLSLGIVLQLKMPHQANAVSSIQKLGSLLCNQTSLRILNVRVGISIIDQFVLDCNGHDKQPNDKHCEKNLHLLEAFKLLLCHGRVAVACTRAITRHFGKGVAKIIYRNITGKEGHLKSVRDIEICKDEQVTTG